MARLQLLSTDWQGLHLVKKPVDRKNKKPSTVKATVPKSGASFTLGRMMRPSDDNGSDDDVGGAEVSDDGENLGEDPRIPIANWESVNKGARPVLYAALVAGLQQTDTIVVSRRAIMEER